MNDNNKNPIDAHLPFFERVQNSDWFQKLTHRKKEAGYGAVALLVLLAIIIGVTYRAKKNQIEDYQIASLYAEQLQKTPKLFENEAKAGNASVKTNDELFASLLSIAKADPLVKERFNGLIAEEFILRDSEQELKPYAKRTIQKLNDSNLPLYASFSEITLLTSENRLKEALEAALHLQQQKELADYPTLYAFTLLQQAALEHTLGFNENAQKTIGKLKTVIQSDQAMTADMAKFISHLQDKQTSLLDFLQQASSKGL